MAGTKRQTSETVLKKLIKHWPGYIIFGSKPYSKGAKIYRDNNTTKGGMQIIQEFPSNDAAFLTMTESITKNNGWFPGKDLSTPLFGEEPEDVARARNHVKEAQRVFYNNARKARDLRTDADQLFNFINMDPLDKNWKRKVNKILNVRRNK
jgi:hypothetical protein